MKTRLIIAALFGITLAQPLQAKEITQGTVEMTGSSSISSGTIDSTDSFSGVKDTFKYTVISVTAGYYIQNNILIGANVTNRSATSSSNDGSSDVTQKQSLVSPIAAYNIDLDPQSSVMLLVGLSGALVGDASVQVGNNPTSNASLSGTLLNVSYKRFISDNVSFNFGFTKDSLDTKPDGSSVTYTDDTQSFDIGLTVLFQ